MTCQQFAYLSSSLPPRRRFLKMSVLCGLGLLVPDSVHGLVRKERSPKRSLFLTHLRRRESLEVIYRTRSGYSQNALSEISYLMRDRRTGEVKKIDPRLLDYLYAIKKILKPNLDFRRRTPAVPRSLLMWDRSFATVSGSDSPERSTISRIPFLGQRRAGGRKKPGGTPGGRRPTGYE